MIPSTLFPHLPCITDEGLLVAVVLVCYCYSKRRLSLPSPCLPDAVGWALLCLRLIFLLKPVCDQGLSVKIEGVIHFP